MMGGFDLRVFNMAISALSTAISLYLAVYTWRRRELQGAVWFTALVSVIAWVGFWYIWEAAVGADLNAYISLSKFEYVGLTFVPVAWLGLARSINGYETPFSRKQLIALSVIPLITIACAWTNEWHGLIWAQPGFDTTSQPPVFKAIYGAMFWVYVAFSYLVFLAGSVMLVRIALGRWQLYRMQSMLVLVGTAVPWIGNLNEIFDFFPVPGLYLNAIFLTISIVALAMALFRIHLLDIMPMAYDRILNSIPSGVVVADMEDRVVALNARIRPFLDQPQQDPIGRPIGEVFTQFAHFVETMRGITNQTFRKELDGRTFEIVVSPLDDGRHEVKGRLFIVNDITERAKTEQAQRQQTQELNRRVESLTIMQSLYSDIGFSFDLGMLLEVSLDGAMRVCLAEGAFIAVMRDGQLHAEHFYGAYQPEALAKVLADRSGIIAECIADQHPIMMTDPSLVISALPESQAQIALPLLVFDQGESEIYGLMVLETRHPARFTEDRFQLLDLLANRLSSAIANAHLLQEVKSRVSELETLYGRVSQLEQIKSDMIRIAAHDLKNPLSVIIGYIELLMRDKSALTPMQNQLYGAIQRASWRMNEIIQDILSLERIEKMADQENMRPFEMRTLVEKAVTEYADRAAEKAQEMLVEMDENRSTVIGDGVQIYEAVVNFISNAIKYTPEGGKIWVMLDRDEQQVRFQVRDTGYGIPDEMQERMFQPFYRARTDETAEIEGTGLGLHLTKNIIERHGGAIIFESVYGKGSTFGLRLPLAQEDAYKPAQIISETK